MKLGWQKRQEKELKTVRKTAKQQAILAENERLRRENENLRALLEEVKAERDTVYRWIIEDVNGLPWSSPETPRIHPAP